MLRRIVIAGIAALLLAPQRSSAQQPPGKIPRDGVLTQASSDQAPMLEAFREGLRALGHVEGRNIMLEFRFGRGDPSRAARLAAELLVYRSTLSW
jgi:putative ABC transport system substrate-binding protein